MTSFFKNLQPTAFPTPAHNGHYVSALYPEHPQYTESQVDIQKRSTTSIRHSLDTQNLPVNHFIR